MGCGCGGRTGRTLRVSRIIYGRSGNALVRKGGAGGTQYRCAGLSADFLTSNPYNDMNQKVVEELARRAKELILDTAEEAEEATLDALERNDGEDDGKAVRAKLSLALEWEIQSQVPKIKVVASYSTKVKREIDGAYDPQQSVFDFSDTGIDKATMKVGDGPEVTVFEREGAK